LQRGSTRSSWKAPSCAICWRRTYSSLLNAEQPAWPLL
jgi:hypothetical protein